MDRAELRSRGVAAARIALDRSRHAVLPETWRRTRLLRALAATPELGEIRAALAARQWEQAHAALAHHFVTRPRRFAIGRDDRTLLAHWIRHDFPSAPAEAAARADRIVAGDYDLLGYRSLRFSSALPDWHRDPVHDRRAPDGFWSTVSYLDPACGDHKIIWELNRHQHWIALGRAYWLTGDQRYRERCIDELYGWLDANPPLCGINWASMLELAFRSLSWLWALHFFVEASADAERPWTVDLLLALDRQLTHVERNLSHYFSPNTHLLGEALALYVAGRTLPELAASRRREETGRRVLVAEIDRQIAADGGHCERAAQYHRYTLDFYAFALRIARLSGDPVAPRFERATAALAEAARLLADDEGRLPHFGDDDGGALLPIVERDAHDARGSLGIAAALLNRSDLAIAPVEEALWIAGCREVSVPRSTSEIRSAALRDTGYYISRTAGTSHVVIDGGPHGYQNGGHAHADALSFTWTVRGVPFLIDPGTACYTFDHALRDRMRLSAMHNTLTIDSLPQSVPDGPFHWLRVADTRVHRWESSDTFDYFDGSHDGYAPLEHRRRVLVLHGDLLVIADLVDGTGSHLAALHWHVDPRWNVAVAGRRTLFTTDGHTPVELFVPDGHIESIAGDDDSGLGWCSPAYGALQKTTTVRVTHEATAPFWTASVFDAHRVNPVVNVEWVPVWAEARAIAHGAALRITRAESTDFVLFAEPAHETTINSRAREMADATWRIAEMQTDARMLYWRTTPDHHIERVAMVDGRLARHEGAAASHGIPSCDDRSASSPQFRNSQSAVRTIS